ncbi:receptor kinase-like protein Xa21 [Lycium barbarum]|uniref:receptor kinase-like protein Xa21 n=1 Tax=Lycium barbarum TaxID=112863 RepID=UPI00293E9551|nr:receptor kinase-like protein Xa21 [Lycium barbarum]
MTSSLDKFEEKSKMSNEHDNLEASSSASIAPPPLSRPWVELPPELAMDILKRLGTIEILESAHRVCTAWWKVCHEPAMWHTVDLKYTNVFSSKRGQVLEKICKIAVDRSQGQLLQVSIAKFGSTDLLNYVAERCGGLQNLESLDLSNNSFSGSIPFSFVNLLSMEILDLSSNFLSGTIPRSLEKLLHLKAINVSFNDLEGVIPSGGVFANSTLQSFLRNKGLCGMHILKVPACAITNPEQQSKSKVLVLKIVTPVAISFFLIFLLVSIWIMKRKKKGKSKDVEKVMEIRTYQLISYQEIQRAANNFDESNLIGVGSSGSVYKGTLSNGTAVAMKVLDLANEQLCKRFDTECEVMRNVRHKNLSL